MRGLGALTAALLIGAAAAHAADNCAALLQQGCSCTARLSARSGVIGELTVAAGDVRKAGAAGYTALPPNARAELAVGDGAIIGDDGRAYLTAGSNCRDRELGPQTSVVVGDIDGCACVAIVGSEGTAPLETGAIGEGGGGAAIAGAAVAGSAALFLLLRQPTSP